MAKTRVDGNRVTIDDLVYEIKAAGPNQYAVFDEFGGKLGYFTVRAKAITPEDYGVAGAHPVKQIARLWGNANLLDEKPAALVTKGICQITTHEAPSDASLESARAHRAWLKKQPGMKASYLVRDPATGKAMSIAIWQTPAHLEASKSATAPEGAPLEATSVEIFPFVEDP